MTEGTSECVAPWWVTHANWLFDHPTPRTIASGVLLIGPIVMGGMAVLGIFNVEGPRAFLVVVALVCGLFGLAGLFAWTFKWGLLNRALKLAVRDHLEGIISTDTVLVGAGTGGAIAVGMVAKACHRLGRPIPRTVSVDQEYPEGKPLPPTGVLVSRTPELAGDILIVSVDILSGKSADGVRQWLAIPDAPIFSFVVRADAKTKARYYLAIGSRGIIPWPPSGPTDRQRRPPKKEKR